MARYFCYCGLIALLSGCAAPISKDVIIWGPSTGTPWGWDYSYCKKPNHKNDPQCPDRK